MLLNVHMLHKPEKQYHDYFLNLLSRNIQISFGEVTETTNYEILIGGRPQKSDLQKPNLHSLIIPFVGIPQVTYHLLQHFRHINVHNIHHNAIATAEMAIALMFAVSKELVHIDQKFRKPCWKSRMVPSLLLHKKNVLIIGYGAIGKKVASMCNAFAMKVTALRKNCTERYQKDNITIVPVTELQPQLSQSNIVIICAPETNETRGMLAQKQLDLLPNGAIVINVGRAAIIDEESLYHSLKKQKIYAGLDVWYNYPDTENPDCFPSRFPLHELDNIVMSPHRSGRCEENSFLQMEHLANLLNIAADGKKMPNHINIDKGCVQQLKNLKSLK